MTTLPSGEQPMASDERARWLLQRLGGLLTAAGAVLYAWIQRGPGADVQNSVLIVAAGLLALWTPKPRVRLAGAAVLFGTAAYWIVGFYEDLGHGDEPAARLSSLPYGRVLLTASVFLVLYQHVLLAAPLVERLHLGRRRFLWKLTFVALTAVSADLYFLPEWFGNFRRLKYHPFLTFDDPNSYKYAHAQERDVDDPLGRITFSQRKPPGTVRIVLMGASTMVGAANPTENSPGARLLHHLKLANPTQPYEIITLAEPGKFQLQELIDAAVTVPHWDPDLVVSWNGFNEVWYGEEDNRYEGMTANSPDVEMSIEASALEDWLFRHSFFGAHLFRVQRVAIGSRYGVHERAPYEPPRYYAYLRREALLLAHEGVRYVHSFCPNVAEKSPRSATEIRNVAGFAGLAADVPERRRRSAEIVRDAGQFSYDVMESLNGSSETLFVDLCHLNDAGADRAAKDLATRVPDWLRAPIPGPLK